jgi:hypothetical protein
MAASTCALLALNSSMAVLLTKEILPAEVLYTWAAENKGIKAMAVRKKYFFMVVI